MNSINKKRVNKYDRVMSRVNNRLRSALESTSLVTRHHIPSSSRLGAKTSSTNLSSSVFCELPVVLNDYVPEKPVQKTFVVKPRRTIKSLDPSKSPNLPLQRSEDFIKKPCNILSQNSAPSMLIQDTGECIDTHFRECYSSRSHSKLRDLKDEIEAYQRTEKMLKLRSHLYKNCGVVLDDAGQIAEDKAVQVESPETVKSPMQSRYVFWKLTMC